MSSQKSTFRSIYLRPQHDNLGQLCYGETRPAAKNLFDNLRLCLYLIDSSEYLPAFAGFAAKLCKYLYHIVFIALFSIFPKRHNDSRAILNALVIKVHP
jgi:hypothetical protein